MAYLLRDKNGKTLRSKVYIKVRWIPEHLFKPYKEEYERIKKGKVGQDIKEGLLKVLVVRAKGIIADDAMFGSATSDPYVKLKFNGVKEAKKRSKTIYKTTNPEWK